MRDEHTRSLDNIERTSKCFEIVNLIIKRCTIFRMTALQSDTLLTVNISLALQYMGKLCIIITISPAYTIFRCITTDKRHDKDKQQCVKRISLSQVSVNREFTRHHSSYYFSPCVLYTTVCQPCPP